MCDNIDNTREQNLLSKYIDMSLRAHPRGRMFGFRTKGPQFATRCRRACSVSNPRCGVLFLLTCSAADQSLLRTPKKVNILPCWLHVLILSSAFSPFLVSFVFKWSLRSHCSHDGIAALGSMNSN